MKIKRINNNKLITSPLESMLKDLVLYTISDNDSKPREAIEKLLEKKGFVSEGDQSTMIRDFRRTKSLNPDKLKDELNLISKKLTFTDGDSVTLIVPGIQKFLLPQKRQLLRPILKRYKFKFNEGKGFFEMVVGK